MSRQVVITGMGVLAPTGKSVAEFWQACVLGKSGIDYIKAFDTEGFEVKIAGEVKGFDPAEYVLPAIFRKIDRFAQFGVCAARMAMEDAKLDMSACNPARAGVIIGSGLGGILFHEEQILNMIRDGGPSRIMASSVPRISPNSVSSYISIAFGLKGPNLAISTACSSGANAIGQAMLHIKAGLVDVCLTGGVEAPVTPVTVGAYQALKCLSRKNGIPAQASAPFDKTRDGFVIGEGAGILVLESLEHAERRKAKIYATVAGYGSNCGAYNMVAPQPDGLDAAEAIQAALNDAKLLPESVDYINAHGTGTPYNDAAETKAIKKVFGKAAYDIPVSSTKSMIGHTIGASGAIEAIVCVLTLNKGEIHPTINLSEPDPECDLDYVKAGMRRSDVRVAVSNSFGFGSNNAVLALKKL